MEERTLTRSESKENTRRRLLDAALHILDEEGDAALTTTSVTREAGVAQSSFYVHFEDMDDLLHHLIKELTVQRRANAREARKRSRAAPRDCDRLRDTFRIPLDDRLAHPRLFRLTLRSRLDRSTPLGEWSRSLHASSRAELVEDLITVGMKARTADERRKVEMASDGISALIDSLALGHLEGRYADREEIVDILVAFFWGAYGHTAAGKGRSRR